jgi:hypothetical protein
MVLSYSKVLDNIDAHTLYHKLSSTDKKEILLALAENKAIFNQTRAVLISISVYQILTAINLHNPISLKLEVLAAPGLRPYTS